MSGEVPGVKRAAIRKLKHELGIEPEQLDINAFKFLTRLHYWAADVVSRHQSPTTLTTATTTTTTTITTTTTTTSKQQHQLKQPITNHHHLPLTTNNHQQHYLPCFILVREHISSSGVYRS
jgi:isopentenyldiphosphate isomerase